MKIKALKTFKWTLGLPEFEQDKIYDVSDSIGIEMIDHNYAIPVKHEDESHKSIKTIFDDKMKHYDVNEDKENIVIKSIKDTMLDEIKKIKSNSEKSKIQKNAKNKNNKKRNKSVKW